MRTVSFADGDPLLNWTMVVAAIEAGHHLPRPEIGDLLLRRGERNLLNRGAWIDGLGMALKSVTVFPDNQRRTPPLPSVQGGMLLFHEETGSLEAVIDGVLVTKWKTAADSALGARLLARPDSRTLLVCGAGTVARTLIEAYRETFPSLRRFLLWNRGRERADALARELAAEGVAVQVREGLAEAVGEADIVASATMAERPFLRGAWVRPGTHVDLIGAYRPDMREADDDLLRRAEIFVDSRETTLDHIGELLIPLADGTIAQEDVRGDLYDLCGGRAGRSGRQAITVYKNGGGAHLDLMTGALILRAVEAAADGSSRTA